ncbi:uncharacterized protein LOC123273383 [Cotesia glomerata]|uniref:uncharacterized protein LOC123273383 n=1 Tax=Cotesia glomerata TaxID=32391 RepID=UPI001D00F345|nr:uncharacterized protein LOC123273383 [Cotesia glomerata]
MLRTRIVTAGLSDTRVRARVRRGCPQGGVTSPLMWILVINELLVALENLGVYAVGYADDVALMIKGSSPTEMRWRTQRALDLIQKWCIGKSLRVNPNKTEMVLFTKRRKLKITAPSIFGMELKFSKEVRYLGVTLDSKLTWRSHIEKQTQKATATFWACRRIFGITWGLKPRLIKWIYTAILVPQLTFASVVWWPSLKKNINIKAFLKVYRLSLLGITGALRTTATLAMGALLNLEPPHITAEALAMKTAMRLLFNGHWTRARTGHAAILRDRGLDRFLTQGGDMSPRSYHFRRQYKVLIPSRQEWDEENKSILSPIGLVWYTDGSKTDKGAGAGIYSSGPKTEISLRLGDTASVFQTEVYAIWACVEHISKLNHRNKHVYICSDSCAALRALEQTEVSSRLVRKCIDSLNELAEYNKVKLLWVPGHSGNAGNDKANELAKAGARKRDPEPVISIAVPFSLIKQHASLWTNDKFQEVWAEAKGMMHTRALFKGPSKTLGLSLIGLDKKLLRLTVGYITGHWLTGRHLRRLGISDHSMCPRCLSEKETPLHLILHCRKLATARKDILGFCDGESIDIQEIGVGQLLHFLKQTGLANLQAI